jgi:hypothetical protein
LGTLGERCDLFAQLGEGLRELRRPQQNKSVAPYRSFGDHRLQLCGSVSFVLYGRCVSQAIDLEPEGRGL